MPVCLELICFPTIILMQRQCCTGSYPNRSCGGHDCSGYQFTWRCQHHSRSWQPLCRCQCELERCGGRHGRNLMVKSRACLGSTYFRTTTLMLWGMRPRKQPEVEVINLAPEDLLVLDDRNLSILENEPNGTLVGVFQGSIQPDHILTTAWLVWKSPILSFMGTQ